jgi:DNA-binding transcriptional LysR family regulator
MNEINLAHLDLNLLVTFEVLMTEGSVTRAAERLSRTQSAVSHSLARLRGQLGDPLLIKVGGAMVPSPFALQLVEDIRPILRSIQRIAALPQHFEPATSERTFRVAVSDFTPSVLPEVMARIQQEAPRVAIEWVTPGSATPMAIADGQVDVALLRSATNFPEGIERHDAGALKVWTYLRKDHPALTAWSLDEWRRWPHVQVVLGDRQQTTLDAAIAEGDIKRTIGARVPHFSCVPDLLARTDMLATLPLLMSGQQLDRSKLCAVEPPMPIASVPLSYFWSFRLTNDPGARWLRSVVMATFADLQRHAALRPQSRGV